MGDIKDDIKAIRREIVIWRTMALLAVYTSSVNTFYRLSDRPDDLVVAIAALLHFGVAASCIAILAFMVVRAVFGLAEQSE